MSSRATSRRWMPPVLDIAFTELARRCAQQMYPYQGWLGMRQRHHILQLVAESERAAGLIETAPAPDAAAQSLIQEPAIGHEVGSRVGSIDIDRAECVTPVTPDSFLSLAGRIRLAVTPNQLLHVLQVATRAQAKCYLPRLLRRQIEGELEGGAGVKA